MLHETNYMDNTPPLYEIRLTENQFEAITNFLPKGFSLEIATIFRKPSIKSKSTVPKELRMLDIDNQLLESLSTSKSSPDRRALRDHSKKKVRDHMGRKYTDYESITMPIVKPFRPSNEGIRKCYNVLQKLKKNENAEPYLSKADAEEYGLTEVFMAIKEPMDLSIVEEKLRDEDYKSVNQFATDVRKIWNNAFRYVPKGSDAYLMAVEISSYFEDLFKEIENVTFTDTVKDLEKKVEQLSQKLVQIHEIHQKQGTQGSGTKSNGGNTANGSASKSSGGKSRSLTLEDKKVLCQKIKKLPPEHLKGVWDIVAKGMKYSMDNKDKLEFDVHSLPVKVVKELEKYVDMKMNELNKLKSKANSKGGKQRKQQQVPVRNVSARPQQQQYMQNSYSNLPVKVVKPNLSEYGSVYGDVPVQQTIEEMDQYFKESVIGDNRGDTESRSGDSSFISDSDSESEMGRKHKNRIVDSFIRTSQDVLNYKPGDIQLYPL